MPITLQEQANLITLYSTPHRHYHTWTHVQYMLRLAKEICFFDNVIPSDIELAIYYHDAIYDPYSKNNEEESMELLSQHPVNEFHKRITKNLANDYIFFTKNHFGYNNSPLLTEQAKIFLDLDLAILGEPAQVYRTVYADNVRKEYYMTPDLDYYEGRNKFLEKVLSNNSIYKTDFFRSREKQARKNLENELKTNDYKISSMSAR